ncbi:DUF1481 domain-containing protein [Erwinia sorbitola]|uniref:DUF1481 domain-containing protein n=1 Tax=Erwinia sorbitola TaxID=2681984 RepID=A0A6I6EW05_9GAMM|nr:DUF1481 domain-containing protein [Erwinia sorbitola]MTD29365.1 DUF1481 domain-containing protein [Erwinia sorbitola]QGU89299.1 DUF1481 domain-containing protein [Erwinia sorbitola]
MKLSAFTRPLTLAMLMLLAGCSSHSDLPDFTASGYLADRGVVRIWRKNQHQQVAHLMTVYTPFNGAATETSDYLWQQDKLFSVERHVAGDKPEDVMLRFDHDGNLSFMQRQLSGRRDALTPDEVALYQFDAQRMLKISDDLLSGSVLLKQGSWQPDGTVITCQGKRVKPEMDEMELGHIARQQRDAAGPVSIAWLEAPGGTQLLMASASDLCKTEPKEEGF